MITWLRCAGIWSRLLIVWWILLRIVNTSLLTASRHGLILIQTVTRWPWNNEVRVRFQASLCVSFHGEISAGSTFWSNNSSVPCKYFSAIDTKLAVYRIPYEKFVFLSRPCSHPENGNVDIFILTYHSNDRLCGLVVRVSCYRYRGIGFDSRRYQIFWVVVGLERGPLSLVRSIEELLE